MCRYRFGDGKCSYPNNMALECVGEDRCQFGDDSEDSPPAEPFIEKEDTGATNTDDRCPNTKTGIYCKKYGYFHCAGNENCQDPEDYMDHLEDHQDKFKNIDIEKEID